MGGIVAAVPPLRHDRYLRPKRKSRRSITARSEAPSMSSVRSTMGPGDTHMATSWLGIPRMPVKLPARIASRSCRNRFSSVPLGDQPSVRSTPRRVEVEELFHPASLETFSLQPASLTNFLLRTPMHSPCAGYPQPTGQRVSLRFDEPPARQREHPRPEHWNNVEAKIFPSV